MKNIISFFLCFIFLSCKSQKVDNKLIQKNAFLEYNLDIGIDSLSITLINDAVIELYKEAKNKNDSLKVSQLVKSSKNKLSKLNNLSSYISYNFKNDTVKIKNKESDKILIPKTLIKHTKRIVRGESINYTLNPIELFKHQEITYTFDVDKNDTKEVLGIKGYKVIITETRVGNYDTFINISEVYVSNKFMFPFNYYEFLDLKRQLAFQGLIIECKTYLKETPNLFNLYTLEDFKNKI